MDIGRENPPVKGAFVKYLKKHGKDKLLSWSLHVKRMVIAEIEKLSKKHNGFQSLLEMEKFQFNQKGPMAPIETRTVVTDVVPKIENSSLVFPNSVSKDELIAKIPTVEKRYGKYLSFGNLSVHSIDFEQAWKTLPSSSLRGIPFLYKGSEIDELIIKIYGNTYRTAAAQFKKIDDLITTPGLRIQGSPKWDPAKVRLINIPSVNYQYMMNGLYSHIKTEMKKLPSMVGWLQPDDRDKIIVDMCMKGLSKKMTPIPLDFRGFDMHMFSELRVKVGQMLLKLFKDKEEVAFLQSKIKQLYENQYLWAPDAKEKYQLIEVPNLLPSGIAPTQADGSTMNAVIQAYLCEKLGFEQDDELWLTLGDDAVIWVPNKILDEYGYEGVLSRWNEALEPLKMEIHVKKKYPLPQVLFLQRLYVPEQDIIGEYSLVRSIDSIIWAERFRTDIEGVLNHMALETIGQISTLNNSMQGKGKVSLKLIANIVVREWLKVDDALCSLAHECIKTKDPEESLFGYLVRATGGLDAIIRAYKLEQYDHKGILELVKNNSSSSFPIIRVIIEEAAKLGHPNTDLLKVYGLRDVSEAKAQSHQEPTENAIDESIMDM